MQKLLLSFTMVLLVAATANAQQHINKINNFADLGVGFGSSQTSMSGSFIHNWQLGKRGRFFIGTGARFTSYFGKNIHYISAPASLAADEQSTDSLFISSPTVHSLNVLVNLGINITSKLQVGFNIDAVGFSFAKSGNTTFIHDGIGVATIAKPTAFNILLIGNNDHGSLNSHFYLQYSFNSDWGVKAAYQYLFTEFTADAKAQVQPEENDRFRNKAAMGYIGITYGF